MNLTELKQGELARIVDIQQPCDIMVHQRLLDLGFIKGAKIAVHNVSPLKDPTAYLIFNTIISLRDMDAQRVLIEII